MEKDNNELIKEMLSGIKLLKKDTPGIELLFKAQSIINEATVNPSLYNEMPYIISTQNMRYLDKVTGQPDNTCIVLGSGDTLFDLLSRGIKNITAVEISDLQILVYKLRRAALLTLNKNEFEDFIVASGGLKFLDKDIYKYVSEALKDDEVSYNVWNNMFEMNPKEDLIKYFFKGIGIDPYKARSSLKYYKKYPTYKKIQDNLSSANIKIVNDDIFNYLMNSKEKFDYIDLSNVLLFVYQLLCNDDEKLFAKKLDNIKQIYENNLNIAGTLVFDYLFGIDIASLSKKDKDPKYIEYIKRIYEITYMYLKNNFDLKTTEVSKVIDGFGPKNDTVIYTKK